MAELEPQFLEVVSTDARELRTTYDNRQPGVMGAGDLKVTAGTGRTVDVAAGVGFVQGTNIAQQQLYRVYNDVAKNSGAFTLGGIPANSSGLDRIDQVIARVMDQSHDSSGLRLWRLEYIAGVGTAAATLDNRNGAISNVALGNNWLRLADVLVPTGASTILAANIRDRRSWARGAYERVVRNANAAAGNDYTTSSATLVDLDATNLARRFELTGVPVRARLSGRWQHSVGGQAIGVAFNDNGAGLDGATGRLFNSYSAVAAGDAGHLNLSWDWIPAPGSHLIKPQWLTSGATATIMAQATQPLIFTVEEIVRQNASNT